MMSSVKNVHEVNVGRNPDWDLSSCIFISKVKLIFSAMDCGMLCLYRNEKVYLNK